MSALEKKRQAIAQKRRMLSQQNRQFSETLVELPRENWESKSSQNRTTARRIAVWQSNRFLVQVFYEAPYVRISVNRTMINDQGHWVEGITWDELQTIKNTIGYADECAMELYPPASLVVNVANMRHLWISPASPPPPFMWNRP